LQNSLANILILQELKKEAFASFFCYVKSPLSGAFILAN